MGTLTDSELFRCLVYLDRDFITGRYEITKSYFPDTQITKTETKEAGAAIPVFSAKVTAGEIRSYKVSTFHMLCELFKELEDEESLDSSQFTMNMRPRQGWIVGELATKKKTRNAINEETQERTEVASETYYHITAPNVNVSLLSNSEYFSSGMDGLLRSHELLRAVGIPVRALVRVLPAQGKFNDWIAVPYVIIDR